MAEGRAGRHIEGAGFARPHSVRPDCAQTHFTRPWFVKPDPQPTDT